MTFGQEIGKQLVGKVSALKTAMVGAGIAAILFVAPAAQANEVSLSGFYLPSIVEGIDQTALLGVDYKTKLYGVDFDASATITHDELGDFFKMPDFDKDMDLHVRLGYDHGLGKIAGQDLALHLGSGFSHYGDALRMADATAKVGATLYGLDFSAGFGQLGLADRGGLIFKEFDDLEWGTVVVVGVEGTVPFLEGGTAGYTRYHRIDDFDEVTEVFHAGLALTKKLTVGGELIRPAGGESHHSIKAKFDLTDLFFKTK